MIQNHPYQDLATFIQQLPTNVLYHFKHHFIPSLYMDSGCASPAAYKAAINDPDTMTYKQAMQDTNYIQEWRKAMDIKIFQLQAIKSWDEVDVLDAKSKIIPGTWVLHVKRTPDGEIKKCKARFCCRGDLQTATFKTFAPVVSWTSICLFLVLMTILHWST